MNNLFESEIRKIMMEKIVDIRNAIKNKTYIAALALALTLPDICSQVEAQSVVGNGNKYITWFDNHINADSYDFSINGFEDHRFDGNMCYALRCKILHNGNADIASKTNIDDFILTKPDNPNYYYGYKYAKKALSSSQEQLITYIGIDYMCETLCKAAEDFYNSWTNKNDFNKYILSL